MDSKTGKTPDYLEGGCPMVDKKVFQAALRSFDSKRTRRSLFNEICSIEENGLAWKPSFVERLIPLFFEDFSKAIKPHNTWSNHKDNYDKEILTVLGKGMAKVFYGWVHG